MSSQKIVPLPELDSFIDRIKQNNNSIILVGGCFDILHRGHVEFLQKSSTYGDVLLVLLESDNNVARRKGHGRPVHSQDDRAQLLAGIDRVGGVVMLDDLEADIQYFELVKQIRPDIIGITDGDPYTTHLQGYADAVGAQLVAVTPRIEGYSTRGIIEKAKNL